MAKSVLERVRSFRKKLRCNPYKYEEYKHKDKVAHKERRKFLSAAEKAKERENCRERVRQHRMRKKLSTQNSSGSLLGELDETAYKTPQTLGKAVRRVKKALPNSPRKIKVVVSKLADISGVKKFHLSHSSNRKLPETTKAFVEKFFLLDSVSRQAPGIRDYVIVRFHGKKAKLQKRHMLWSLKETYSLFTQEHPNVKISFSKFCSLRPPNVLLSKMMPRNVCLCQQHDNFKLLCEVIHKVVPEFPLYSRESLNTFVCNSEDEKCMTGRCKKCPSWMDDLKALAPLDDEIDWYQWERVVLNMPQKKGKPGKTKKKIQKVLKEGTVEEAFDALSKKLPGFLDHVYVKRKQSRFFEEKISNLKPNEAAVQVDFSENYTCAHQDEIQAAHWDQSQVTIFPVVVWTSHGCESYAFVSDERNHDKQSVSVFVDKVLTSFIAEKHKDVEVVHIFSDGPSSQFKNKYIVHLLHELQQQSGLQLKWHYFASSHGKGAVDGIGGTVKRSVWSAVATRKVPLVDDAKSFAAAANDVCNLSTKVVLVTKKEIQKSYPGYHLHNAKPMPGISKIHCVEPSSNGTVTLKKYSTQQKNVSVHEIYADDVRDMESFQLVTDESDVESVPSEMSNGKATCSSSSAITDESDDENDLPDENPDVNHRHLDVDFHLPSEISQKLSKVVTFSLPQYKKPLLEAILLNDVAFGGSSLINLNDLMELSGRGKKDTDKWLSNFVIDGYLKIISTQASLVVKTLPWEKFEKCSVGEIARELSDGFDESDLILVPCNQTLSEHWFLVAMYPKLRFIVALDSHANDSGILKPTIHLALEKIMSVIQKLLTNHSTNWKCFCNKKADVLQQGNGYDCGVFVCMYARALAFGDPLIEPCSVPGFREGMIVELHEQKANPVPATGPEPESYYVVDYVNKYYIGRLLAIESGLLRFKVYNLLLAQTR